MGSFFSLFHCESFEGNRGYENQFQWFVVSSSEEKSVRRIERIELERLITRAREEPSDHETAISLARLLGASLKYAAYELFIQEIGLAIAIAIFYDDGVENVDGLTDFERTKDAHYRKYCFFKFASFLDLLCPGSVRWRGQAELESTPVVCIGLDQFQAADLQGRATILSRWFRQPGISAFSEKSARQSKAILERRAFLRSLPDNLAAAHVARRMDEAGVKRGTKYSSYSEWHLLSPKAFESWLSRERAESRRVWKAQPRIRNPKSKLS
jgi:hypothetical protein